MDLLPIDVANATHCVGLKSQLTQSDALAAFRRRDAGWVRRVRQPRLRSIARVYVPYYLFQVRIADGRRRQTGLFALDGVSGTLDPYSFKEDLHDIALEPVQSRNRLTATLAVETAWPMLVDKLQRVVFQTGFFRLRNPRFSAVHDPRVLQFPYWVGFYADGPFARLDVLDAVRQRFEGAKARALFETWLADVESPLGSSHV